MVHVYILFSRQIATMQGMSGQVQRGLESDTDGYRERLRMLTLKYQNLILDRNGGAVG